MILSAFADALWPQLEITDKTRSDYISNFQCYFSYNIGKLNIESITRREIIDAISFLPPQTAYKSLMVVKTLFREATNRELIDINPAKEIRSPKINVKPQKFLTWQELEQIDFGFQTKRIRFLALHGLRFGEAAALTSQDIKDGRVFIKRSKWGETKTPSGVRSVPLLSEFQPFPLYQGNIAKALAPYGVTVHSLRKTYAYILKSSQVHVTTASKLMGHSNPMITLKIYTQVLDSEIDEAGQSLRNFVATDSYVA